MDQEVEKMTINATMMRAGTSRGLFFLGRDLPIDQDQRDHILIHAIGSHDPLQLEGVGGGTTLTSKVAIVSPSTRGDCDVDYLFVQIDPTKAIADSKPNCGNMLSGVGPFAIEQGLVPATDCETVVRIHNVNTKSRIDATIQTPKGVPVYDGLTHIDGVKNPASPIRLSFHDAFGGVTGHLFPTGHRQEVIQGIDVTCIDAAMPLVMMRADQLGFLGNEKPHELDNHEQFVSLREKIRLEAGKRMGLGDVTHLVIPKPVLVSHLDDVHHIQSRYFTPHKCHTSHAITGAVGVATAMTTEGTVACTYPWNAGHHQVEIHHPAGKIGIEVHCEEDDQGLVVRRANLLRTARKILEAKFFIPDMK